MAKKSRSKRKSSSRKSAAARAQAAEAPKAPVSLKEEYQYVVTDLQRIGVIAVILIAVLVALSFIL